MDEDEVPNPVPPRALLMELRFQKGMTREAIAEHFNVSIATVRRWVKDLGIPRPARRKKPIRVISPAQRPASNVHMDDSYSRFERARIILEGRVIERTGRGYFLDGRPCSAEAIIEAAGL